MDLTQELDVDKKQKSGIQPLLLFLERFLQVALRASGKESDKKSADQCLYEIRAGRYNGMKKDKQARAHSKNC